MLSSSETAAKQMPATPRGMIWQGMVIGWPLLLSIVPFGMITGVAAVATGFSLPLAMGMTTIVFAGASQLAAMDLIVQGTAAAVIVLTAAMINLRFLLYSASLAPHFQREPLLWKLLLAYLITDPAFGVAIGALNERIPAAMKRWFFLGTGGLLWFGWVVGTLIGVVVGAQLPSAWSLDFAISLNFIAVLVPAIRDRATVTSAVIAALIALLARGLPFNLGLIVGALCGIAAGMLLERWQPKGSADDA